MLINTASFVKKKMPIIKLEPLSSIKLCVSPRPGRSNDEKKSLKLLFFHVLEVFIVLVRVGDLRWIVFSCKKLLFSK